MGDHAETVQIDFDPERIAYEDLLAVFWASHDPRWAPRSVQYKNVVFVHDDEQRRAAERTRDHMARVNGYLDGYGTLEQLESEIDRLGLAAPASAQLQMHVSRRRR